MMMGEGGSGGSVRSALFIMVFHIAASQMAVYMCFTMIPHFNHGHQHDQPLRSYLATPSLISANIPPKYTLRSPPFRDVLIFAALCIEVACVRA